MTMTPRLTSGNPITPGPGVCDHHARIYDDRAYLSVTPGQSATNTTFVMDDWWIRSSPDLINWQYDCTVPPE